MPALCKGFPRRCAEVFDGFDACLGKQRRLFAGAEFLRFVYLVVEAVEHKIQKIRHDGFRTLTFQKLHQMVVGGGGKFYENFPHNAYPRFYGVSYRYRVKFFDDLPAHFLERERV